MTAARKLVPPQQPAAINEASETRASEVVRDRRAEQVVPPPQPTPVSHLHWPAPASKALPSRDLLTVQEVADYLRVSCMTVYRMVKHGDLVAFRVGRMLRIRRASVPGVDHPMTDTACGVRS